MIVGSNGAGKTNLLEGVHMGTQGFSPRTHRDARAIRFGAAGARIEVEGMSPEAVCFRSEVTITTGGTKRISIDGADTPGPEALRRRFPVLAFTPDRLAIVKGGPVVRRAYLDRTLGRLFPARADLPGEYSRALAQRNAALRRTRERLSTRDALAPWTDALVTLGAALEHARRRAVADLDTPFAHIAAALGLENAALRYTGQGITRELLASRLERDVERGTTSAGPHLDDLAIMASGRDLRAFGSQGEQRLAVLSLLLAEARVFEARSGEAPLLLLDDVLSELDDARRVALTGGVPESCQTLVTATSLRSLPPGVEPAVIVDVAAGRASRR
jgi:DNA replication and repair protein RecF